MYIHVQNVYMYVHIHVHIALFTGKQTTFHATGTDMCIVYMYMNLG